MQTHNLRQNGTALFLCALAATSCADKTPESQEPIQEPEFLQEIIGTQCQVSIGDFAGELISRKDEISANGDKGVYSLTIYDNGTSAQFTLHSSGDRNNMTGAGIPNEKSQAFYKRIGARFEGSSFIASAKRQVKNKKAPFCKGLVKWTTNPRYQSRNR
jgi:hypothetical protein